jgi:hypothetical protein
LWQVVAQNWVACLEWFGVYLVAGVAWSFAKWYFFVLNKKRAYTEILARFLAENKLQNLNDPASLKKFNNVWALKSLGKIPPQANENKSEIIGWISYWPWSAVWTLLDDFVTKIFQEIYARLAGTFQKISDNQFKDMNLKPVPDDIE